MCHCLNLFQGYLLLKDCRQHTVLSPLKDFVRKGSIVTYRGKLGWLLLDNVAIRVSCKSGDMIRIPSVLLSLLMPVQQTMRLELLTKKLNLLYKISALQVDDDVYVKVDRCSIPQKATIRFRGTLPAMEGERFGVELLVGSMYMLLCF